MSKSAVLNSRQSDLTGFCPSPGPRGEAGGKLVRSPQIWSIPHEQGISLLREEIIQAVYQGVVESPSARWQVSLKLIRTRDVSETSKTLMEAVAG
jgi:hypothetical protein